MDKLSGLASKFTGKSESGEQPSSSTQDSSGTSGSSSGDQRDYLDKALDTAEDKISGGKIDTEKYRETNEKITDAARERFEKATGKKVPEKFSN